jgi:hypothetical protein
MGSRMAREALVAAGLLLAAAIVVLPAAAEYPRRYVYPLRLVCHKWPGRTTLSHIPKSAFTNVPVPYIRVDGIDVTHKVRHGRASVRTPRGLKRGSAVISVPSVARFLHKRCVP